MRKASPFAARVSVKAQSPLADGAKMLLAGSGLCLFFGDDGEKMTDKLKFCGIWQDKIKRA